MPKHPRATVASGINWVLWLRTLFGRRYGIRDTIGPIGPCRPAPAFTRVRRTMCCRAVQVAKVSPEQHGPEKRTKQKKKSKKKKDQAIIAGN